MIKENYDTLNNAINKALSDAKRTKDACSLIAVSKMQESAAIKEVLALGHIHFGENYVQEAKTKWESLKTEFPLSKLHLIGALQSNKAKEAVELFDVIQTLDRVSLAEALRKEFDKQGKAPKLFIQINTCEEPQKGGVLPLNADKFIETMQNEYKFEIEGLMCIPPDSVAPAPHFGLLHILAKKHGIKQLSMGMSSDYMSAINMGATFIRVGSALFGARQQKI